MQSTTMHGARAKLLLNGSTVGLFSDTSLSYDLGVQEIYTLGRFEAQETVITSHETVRVSGRGFRVVQGSAAVNTGTSTGNVTPYSGALMATVKDLLLHNDFTIQLVDRQSGQTVQEIVNCRPQSFSIDYPAKGVSTFSINFVGIKMNDESIVAGTNQDSSAVKYPQA